MLRSKFRPLRSQFVFLTLRQALAKATRRRDDFRIVHFSVQFDHLHLIVEAKTKVALSRGVQGLAIRVAKQINRLIPGRRGKLWADRFYSRELTSPNAMRNALCYVLGNFRKHTGTRVHRIAYRIDPYSSAPYFAGFAELGGFSARDLPHTRDLPVTPRGVPPPESDRDAPLLPATTWLARSGWKRAGTVRLNALG